jgi:DNA-binding SARP family transcriptional activator
MARGGQALDFAILGPFEARGDAGPVELRGGKQRALLALLLLNADRVVSVDRIVEDLWGEEAPETASKMVQIFVSQLRKALPEGTLQTRAPGYLVTLAGHSLDLGRFEGLHEQGRAALAAGRAEEAAQRLQEALGLWRGPALGEFEEPFAQLESARLEELHLACLEDRIQADLARARHAEVVGELERLVRREPQRERPRAQLMLALYRSGRQAEALDTYHQFRRMLDDELGIDPSARLKELERQILQQDPSLEPPASDARAAPGRAAVAPSASEPPPPSPHGRQRELAHLERLFAETLAGARRLAFVTGEAGIGKTTIVQGFLGSARAQAVTARGQCVEHRGAGEPYLPILEALSRLARQSTETIVPLLARQAPMWLAQMPWLLDDDELAAVQRRTVGATHARMLREMLETLEALSASTPLVLVLEDLHWADPSTIDLLDALARRDEPARLLVLGTFRRSDAVAAQHPIHRLAQSLRGRGLCADIAVGPLDSPAVGSYAAARLGDGLGAEVAGVLHERAGGHPLFVTTLLDSWLEQGLLDERPVDTARLAQGVPHTLRELIEQALAQLDASDCELLAAASVTGQEFSSAAAAAASERPPLDVEVRCDALADAGHLVVRAGSERWPDGTVTARYRFAHDLHREVLYEHQPAALRAQAHGRIGRRLVDAHASSPKEIAATAAEHFVLAGDAPRAATSLQLAALQAFERRANPEALEHLLTGLEMVRRMPESPERLAAELALQPLLGAADVAARGWSSPDAEAAFVRGRDLAERLGRSDELGWALFRLGSLYEVRGEYDRSESLLEEALAVSGATVDAGLLTDAHARLACSLFHQGAFDGALDHAEQGLAAYDGHYFNPVTAAYGDDAGAACHSWAALSLWFLGYPDMARERALEAVALTDDPHRRHGYANALAQAAIVEQCRLDVAAARRHAEAAIDAATRDGYAYRRAMAMVVHGWALAAGGEHQRGIAEIEDGLALSRETGAHMDDPYYFALLADARARAGHVDAALAAVEAGLARTPVARRFFFESELRRLEGVLLLQLGRVDEGEARLRDALRLASERHSPSLELRAALGLAGRLRARGRDDEARTLVSGASARFGEGFETHDLVAAAALLAELGAPLPQRR